MQHTDSFVQRMFSRRLLPTCRLHSNCAIWRNGKSPRSVTEIAFTDHYCWIRGYCYLSRNHYQTLLKGRWASFSTLYRDFNRAAIIVIQHSELKLTLTTTTARAPPAIEVLSKVEHPSEELADSYDVQLHNDCIRLWSLETTERRLRASLRHVISMVTTSRREMWWAQIYQFQCISQLRPLLPDPACRKYYLTPKKLMASGEGEPRPNGWNKLTPEQVRLTIPV